MPVRGLGPGGRLRAERRRGDPLHARHRGARPHSRGLSPLVTVAGGRAVAKDRSSFVGREAELDRIAAALESHQLVTVTGLGGAGKTRVALETASRLAGRFGGRVVVVELGAAATPEAVFAAVSAPFGGELGHGSVVDPVGAVAGHLRLHEALLVFDNCEHLLPPVTAVVDRLLGLCPSLRVLATSREPMHLPGEVVVRIGPLEVGPRHAGEPPEAVRLFVDRAASADAGFVLGEENIDAVVEVCEKVDGIPLAIELAAARVSHMSLAEIVRLLEERVLELPARGLNAEDRHRTMTATLDWSFELLGAEEREVFCGLSVFARGAEVDAVHAVCARSATHPDEVLEVVAGLVDKSLLVVDQESGTSRVLMVDTVRRYAATRLAASGCEDDVRRRQAAWLADRAPVGAADDVVSCLGWALQAGETKLAARLAARTWKLWEATGRHNEGRELLDRVLAADGDEPEPYAARVTVATANLALAAGDYGEARRRFEAGIAVLDDLGLVADVAGAKSSLSMVAMLEGDTAGARRVCIEALEALEGLDDQDVSRAFALSALGIIEGHDGDTESAEQHLLDALTSFRRLGLKREAANVLNNLGNLAADAGEPGRAHRFYEGALQLQRDVGDRRGAALSLNNLCLAAQQRGNLDRAWEHAEAARQLFHEIGDRTGEAATVNNLANLAVERGHVQEAIDLYRHCVEEFRELGDARRLATALENFADLAAGLEERQLAWSALVDAASIWNHLGQADRLTVVLGRLSGLGVEWEVARADALPVVAVGAHDPAATAHALEAARWAGVPPPPRQQVRSPGGQLTPRESQVAGLVGRGLSNAEIGRQLFISERTVESHISNARMKLGIDSRTRLTRWAMEQGLAG